MRVHESMPRANFFKDKDIKITWNPAKAKKGDTASAREYAVYSKSKTTREFYSYSRGSLASKHFTHDMRMTIKALFSLLPIPRRRNDQNTWKFDGSGFATMYRKKF